MVLATGRGQFAVDPSSRIWEDLSGDRERKVDRRATCDEDSHGKDLESQSPPSNLCMAWAVEYAGSYWTVSEWVIMVVLKGRGPRHSGLSSARRGIGASLQ